ncbi:hypothetical protein SBA3_3610007 [Candidatus Sulfopaludibacter sp. SbA3]|nr:hypothetical protein SBA3_3610007 [Candidatus Sulfopaludibacter sp. SbA3]
MAVVLMSRIYGQDWDRRHPGSLAPSEKPKQNLSEKERPDAFCAIPLVGAGRELSGGAKIALVISVV